MEKYMNKACHLVQDAGCFGRDNIRDVRYEAKEIALYINDRQVKVDPYDLKNPEISLARYLRETLGLTGTKISCEQGGCGACVVTAVNQDNVVKSVNSCLTPLLLCNGWKITTIEGLGSSRTGMNPIQKELSAKNGTQCGFCSPGMVMSMNSLLQSKGDKASKKDVETILDGSICRCTGYRPILDAFKNFSDECDASDKPSQDIEDLSCFDKTCCKDMVNVLLRDLNNGNCPLWVQPTSLKLLLKILKSLSAKTKYKLVSGSTGKGVYDDGPYGLYIDISRIEELRCIQKEPLTLGGAITIAHFIEVLDSVKDTEGYSYAKEMMAHLKKVANTSVRNCGSIAGNLMLKHQHWDFPSDLFVLLEGLGALLEVRDSKKTSKVLKLSLSEFLRTNMDGKVISKVFFPKISNDQVFRSYKVMNRRVNDHAIVNACFLLCKSSSHLQNRIVFGGISGQFIHASKTEALAFIENCCDPNSFMEILKVLHDECVPDDNPSQASQEYRRYLATALFYKAVLSILGDEVDPKLRSGSKCLERNISRGEQHYKTDSKLFPINEPIPKLEGAFQCSGEAEYIDDISTNYGELHGAFVVSNLANCELDTVDSTEALKIPGVVSFIDYRDIPGKNSCNRSEQSPEEIFSSGKIFYAGQAIGLIVAKTALLAKRAAKAVKVTYKNIKKPILTIRDAIKETNHSEIRHSDDGIEVSGEFVIGSQYHFHMETQSCIVKPIEEGQFEVVSSTQWMDKVQLVIAQALNIKNCSINISVRRLGGAFGAKISRANQIAAAAALAANKLNAPVRVVLDIKTNMEMVGKRLPYLATYKLRSTKDGLLKDVKMNIYCDCGHLTNESTAPDAATFAQGCYNSPVWDVVPNAVTTNTAVNTFCRAPGTTQGHAIIENAMEHLAHALGMDPVELRMKNMIKNGDKLIGGGTFQGLNPLPDIIDHLKSKSDFDKRKKRTEEFNKANLWKKRGLSLVPVKYLHIIPTTRFYARVVVYHSDGSVAVSHGGIEMGQGINTKVAQVVAKEFGISVDKVSVKPATNFNSPNTTATDASNGSECVCAATKRACELLKERMKPFRTGPDQSWNELVHKSYRSGVDLTTGYMGNNSNDDLPTYDIWGAIVTEVELDILTGERNILRCDIVEDTGTSINPAVDIGQVEGGFVMSIGLWTSEEIKFHPKTGQILTYDTWNYKPPSALDIPEDFRITFYDSQRNPSAFLGAKATGEPCMLLGVSVLFALRQAVTSARSDLDSQDDSWFQLDGPATPERLHTATGLNFNALRIRLKQ